MPHMRRLLRQSRASVAGARQAACGGGAARARLAARAPFEVPPPMTLTVHATAVPGVLVATGPAGSDGGPEPIYAAAVAPGPLAERLARAELFHLAGHGALRGLYRAPGQVVLRCVQGRVWAVAVDLRAESPAFRRSVGLELAASGPGLVVPGGCAHGFVALAERATVLRLAASDAPGTGLRWDDPALAIAWPVTSVLAAAGDLAFPRFVAPG
jgi:dTDP-4-dehydrorhamnose 3,5-epimerase